MLIQNSHYLYGKFQALGNVPAACAGDEDIEGGYNSEDEYSHIGVQLTEEEWQEKDRRFERLIKKKKGNLNISRQGFG